MSNSLKGLLAAAGSAMAFGLAPFLAMLVYEEGGDPFSLTFYRYVFTVFIMLFFILGRSRRPVGVTRGQVRGLFFIGVFAYGLTGFLLNFSYTLIPTGLTTTLHFLYPMLVVVLGAIFYEYQVSWASRLAVILSLGGIILFGLSPLSFHPLGVFLALLSALTYAFYIIFIDRLALTRLSIFTLTFFLALSACLPAGLAVLVRGSSLLYSPKALLATLALALVTAIGGTCLFQYGVRHLGPMRAAILSTLEPVTSILLGFILLKEPMTGRVLLGIFLILLASLLVILRGRPLGKQHVWTKRKG